MGEDVATEEVWSEPDEQGVRTLVAAIGDRIPEDFKTKARTPAKHKARTPTTTKADEDE